MDVTALPLIFLCGGAIVLLIGQNRFSPRIIMACDGFFVKLQANAGTSGPSWLGHPLARLYTIPIAIPIRALRGVAARLPP